LAFCGRRGSIVSVAGHITPLLTSFEKKHCRNSSGGTLAGSHKAARKTFFFFFVAYTPHDQKLRDRRHPEYWKRVVFSTGCVEGKRKKGFTPPPLTGPSKLAKEVVPGEVLLNLLEPLSDRRGRIRSSSPGGVLLLRIRRVFGFGADISTAVPYRSGHLPPQKTIESGLKFSRSNDLAEKISLSILAGLRKEG